MRFLLIFLFVIVASWTTSLTVYAKTPPDVLKSYKAYNSALKLKNYDNALMHAKSAWQKAESAVGENKLTGDLAYNYGFLAAQMGKPKLAVKALERSIDLSVYIPNSAGLVRLEREVELCAALINSKNFTKAKKRLRQALSFARLQNLDDTIFAGELMMHQALLKHNDAIKTAQTRGSTKGTSRRSLAARKLEASAEYAQNALAIFEKQQKFTRAENMINAYKLIGLSKVVEKQWVDAALMYQKAMLIEKKSLDISDPIHAATVGHWLRARSFLRRNGLLETAREKGLCNCWPYEGEEQIVAKPVKRMSPTMPADAQTSGYAIVKFDLDDEGNIINPKIIHTFPEKIFEKPTLKSVKDWKYESIANGVKGAQRIGIVTSIQFFLNDEFGLPI